MHLEARESKRCMSNAWSSCEAENSAFRIAFIDEVGKMLLINERLVPNSKNFAMHEFSLSLTISISLSAVLLSLSLQRSNLYALECSTANNSGELK